MSARVLLVFVDGLGVGRCDPSVNPIHRGGCPHIQDLLEEHSVPIDARLGVAGLPQSATGQTALLTGVNAAEVVGRHIEGFPGDRLRTLIEEQSIFRKLQARRLAGTFANAYYVDRVDEVHRYRLQSVTTVATLSAYGAIRDKAALAADDAVYQDITRESLRARGYGGRLVSPAEAARHLVAIAERHTFTLFEYFLTDRAGHTADVNQAARVLSILDPFIGELVALSARQGLLFVLTSDHGNIEDIRVRTHTMNPVPLAAIGPGADFLREEVRSITEVTPALLSVLGGPSMPE